MKPVTEAKMKAIMAYKETPTPDSLRVFKTAKAHAHQVTGQCSNTYWLNLCSSIQSAADMGNAKAMFENIKKATDPLTSKVAP